MKKYIWILILVLFGCGGNTQPEWFLKHHTDTPGYIYAAGSGKTKEEALNSALSFAASKVSVTINSTFTSSKEYTQTNSESQTYRQLKKQIVSKVKDMEFSDYQIVKKEKRSSEIYVLIRINRHKNASIMLEKVKDSLYFVKKEMDTDDRLKVLTKFPKLLKILKEDIYKLYTAQILDPGNAEIKKTLREAILIKSELEERLNSLSVDINVRNNRVKKLLKEVFTDMNIAISDKGIKLSSDFSKENKKIFDYYITTISMMVYLKDKTQIALKVKCGGKSISGFQMSENFAYQKCKEKLEKKLQNIIKGENQ